MSTFERDKQNVAIAAQKEANVAAYKAWVVKHPEFYDCEANRNMLFGTYGGYMDFTDPLSEADLDFAYGNLKSHLALQRVPTPAEIKVDLINQIMERLQTTNNKHWQVPHNVQTERTKMNFWDVEQLTERLEAVVRAQTLNAKSPVELREIAYGNKEAQSNWPRLPLRMVPRGQVTSIAIDADHLNKLATHDKYEFVRLCKLFGTDAVDRRRGIKQ